MDKKLENVKIMADLLRQGATLMEHSCPACSSPIFKMRSGDLWCASCQKRVIILKEGEPEPKNNGTSSFVDLEITIINKIQQIEKQLEEEMNPEKLKLLGETLSTLLESLEKIRSMKK